jgi:rhodanese-related sulfurtransferase
MKTIYALLAIGGLWLAALPASAQSPSDISIAGLQLPAWVERDGVRQPLRIATRIKAGDSLHTGEKARIILNLPDASTVKLGEKAEFKIQDMQPAAVAAEPFKAFLRVVGGAFRYTTSKLGKEQRREIDIQVGRATMGIRGTDVWGKSEGGKDLICLIEGQIEISRPGEKAVPMQDPLSVYTAAHDKAPDALWKVEIPMLQTLALETELAAGEGVLQPDGKYVVYLYSAQQSAEAERFQKKMNKDGYATEIYAVEIDGKNWHRVGISQFASRKDATAFVGRVKELYDLQGAWVGKL